jgi:hypothetical protein
MELVMQGRIFFAALLGASLAWLGGAATGSGAELQISTTPVVMDHVTIETSKPYQMVTSRLNEEVKRFDESYRTLLNENKIDELRAKLILGLEPDGLMIHFVAQQGDLSALDGTHRQGNVYYLGNVIAAAQLTKVNFSAALYAPLRLNVYENAHGGTTFEYDRPSTQFGQFHDAEIDSIAHILDDHMLRLITKVSS